MAKQYSRREMLRALALGGAVVAGELWIPGQKLISIPSEQELRYKATYRYSHGWTHEGAGFGSAVVKPEGGVVMYDAAYENAERQAMTDPAEWTLEGNEEALVFNEASLEQIVIDIRDDMENKFLAIKPRSILRG